MLLLGFLLLLFAGYLVICTNWVRRSVYRLDSTLDTNIRVVHLSDLHGRTRFINGSLSKQVNRLEPDYVLLTGDLISKLSQLPRVLNEIRKIRSPHLLFVPGNYEREGLDGVRKRMYSEQEYDHIVQALQAHNITVLSNSGVTFGGQGQGQGQGHAKKGLIYGFDNSIYGNERLTMETGELQQNDYIILMAHSPNIVKLLQEQDLPYDLLLTGHTHGGQVRLFNRTIGAYRHYHVGMKQIDSRRHFFIHRGLGTVKLPFRFGVFPEVVLFQINNK